MDPDSVRKLRNSLLAWYREAARDLPWRRTRDPYRVWLSEVMLQQTRVETVLLYYERFLAAFPDVHALARADVDAVLRLWAGLGYYSRARNLHRAAGEVTERHGGRFPRSAAELQRLPGIGRYTAAAIASISGDEPVAVLDGNVKRVLARLFAVEQAIDEPATTETLWALADDLLDRGAPGDFNQALMEVGARICRPRRPDCDGCPVRGTCQAARRGLVGTLPRRSPKRRVPHVTALAGVLVHEGRVLIVRRASGLLGGLWRFPALEARPGPAGGRALGDHLAALAGGRVTVASRLGVVRHVFTHRSLSLTVYGCTLATDTRAPRRRGQRWVRPGELDRYFVSTVDRRTATLLRTTSPS